MVSLRNRALLWALLARGRVGPAAVLLGLGVTAWSLLAFGLLAPTAAEAAQTPDSVIVPGGLARVEAPPLQVWLIPTDRATYEAYHRAIQEDDEGSISEASSRPGWISVADGQVIRVVLVDEGAVQVEMLDGPDVGGQGWLKTRQLRSQAPE
jgi:hypothetical protein